MFVRKVIFYTACFACPDGRPKGELEEEHRLMPRPARITRKARGWHPEEIKAAIRMRGSSMAELSRQHGYGISAVRQVLRRPWPAIERLVAEYLGVEPQEIWPERYGEDGMPNRLLFGRVKFNPERTDCQRKKVAGE